MNVVLRFTLLEAKGRQEIPLHATYLLAEVQHEIDQAIEHGGEVKLLNDAGQVFGITPADYATLAVVNGDEA